MINDFYKGTTKKFNLTIQISGSIYPDITNDTILFLMKDNKTDVDYVLTSSADVTSSGSVGIAKFNITPSQTENLNPEIYNYEIIWNLSTGEEYVLEQNSVNILSRI